MSDQEHTTSIEYRDIKGFPGYRVGSDGSVWSRLEQKSHGSRRGWLTVLSNTWRKLSPGTWLDGYKNLRLCDGNGRQKTCKVHTVVLEAFVGPRPPGMVCRHFPDRDPGNNRLENLSWGTVKQNAQDKITHGTSRRGITTATAKLRPDQVIEIRRLVAEGNRTFAELARRFGVERKAIKRIVSGESYRHVQTPPLL